MADESSSKIFCDIYKNPILWNSVVECLPSIYEAPDLILNCNSQFFITLTKFLVKTT
jgi:hypothetical protein